MSMVSLRAAPTDRTTRRPPGLRREGGRPHARRASVPCPSIRPCLASPATHGAGTGPPVPPPSRHAGTAWPVPHGRYRMPVPPPSRYASRHASRLARLMALGRRATRDPRRGAPPSRDARERRTSRMSYDPGVGLARGLLTRVTQRPRLCCYAVWPIGCNP